jgi:hypothetical protein
MDVHAPHQPVHTWRDFLIHLAIVTIGLFIALMLEALVEHVHHRHLVAEARENLHREIAANCASASKDLGYSQVNVGVFDQNIRAVHALQTHAKGDFHISNTMEWSDFSSAGWRTAHETGALGYMPYDEVQRYSDLYTAQDFLETRAEALFDRNILAGAPFKMGLDPEKLPAEAYGNLLRDNAQVEVEFVALTQVLQQYQTQCNAALSKGQ